NGLWLWSWFLAGWLGLVGLIVLLIGAPDQEGWKRIGFWWVSMSLTFAAFCLTRAGSGPHHAAMLAGLPQICFIAVLAEARNAPASRRLRSGLTLAPIVVAYMVTLSVISAWTTVSAFARPSNNNWDPANDRAAQFAASFGETSIAVDWGLGT